MKPLAPETARLLADISVRQGAGDEAPDERLARLQGDPAALFAAINLPSPPSEPPNDSRRDARAAIAITLAPVHEPPRRPVHGKPAAVLHTLKKTAPAICVPTADREESPAPFTPTAADRHEAIECWEPGLLTGKQLLAAALICALLLFLLLQFG